MVLAVDSVWMYFLISAAFLGGAALTARSSRFYRQYLAQEATAVRYHAIDGLRGFLALGVVFAHALISYYP